MKNEMMLLQKDLPHFVHEPEVFVLRLLKSVVESGMATEARWYLVADNVENYTADASLCIPEYVQIPELANKQMKVPPLKFSKVEKEKLDKGEPLFLEKEQLWVYPLVDSRGVLFSYLACPNVEEKQQENLKEFWMTMKNWLGVSFSYWMTTRKTYVDDVTDLFNQRYLPIVLDKEIKRCQRMNGKFTVLFLDIDYFKMVNDSKGHWVGSKLIRQLGQIIKSNVRAADFPFRYGGDEYVVILVDTDAKQAVHIAERIRKCVEETDFLIDGHSIRLTVSIGLASYPDHAATPEEVMKLADEAMYYGKSKSRNIVFIAS